MYYFRNYYLTLVLPGNMNSFFKTFLWIATSVSSSVGLILINKVLMGPPFNFVYVFTLTSIHFLTTALIMEILAVAQLFSRSRLPWTSSANMAFACASSVGLMNLSLRLNSLGFYQLSKLLGTPWLVFVQAIIYKVHTSCSIKLSLVVIFIGMALISKEYVYWNIEGCIVGIAAIVITVQFQIWQGQKQYEHKLNALQINHAQALPTFVACAVLAVLIEFNYINGNMNIFSRTWTMEEIKWIVFSAILAASVNLCSYGLIGHTSTVTFQIVGHAKTVLVLISGYFFHQKRTQISWNDVFGVSIVLGGTVLYSVLSHKETNNSNLCVKSWHTVMNKLLWKPCNRRHILETSAEPSNGACDFDQDAPKPV